MKRRDIAAGLVMASAMRYAVAQQPIKAKRIALVASKRVPPQFDTGFVIFVARAAVLGPGSALVPQLSSTV